jgi:hypothetical protein
MMNAEFFQLPLCCIIGQAQEIEYNTSALTFEFFEVWGHRKQSDDLVADEYALFEYRCSKIWKVVVYVRITHLKGNAEYGAHEACLVFDEQSRQVWVGGGQWSQMDECTCIEL